MSGVFLKILNMSIAACWLILALLLLRPLLKKAPRQLSCLLWALAALRLILPFAPQSPISLVPSANTVKEGAAEKELDFDTGFLALNSFMSEAFDVIDEPAAVPVESIEPITPAQLASSAVDPRFPASSVPRSFDMAKAASIVWLCGACGMACYGIVSYLLLKRRVRASIEEGGVYRCDDIRSPFILGVLHPRIYVPSSLENEGLSPVLAHERAHIARGDHVWKPLGFCLLCAHWFNPLVWIAYSLFCRDVETACDERVIRGMEREERAAYSKALMRLACPGSVFSACPVAFGEISVKDRVKNVLSYKKPAFWVLIAGGLVLVGLGAAFLTDPIRSETKCYRALSNGAEYRVGMSEASARRIGRLLKRQKLNEEGPVKGVYRIMLGKRELSYEPESGTLYEPAKRRFTTVDDSVKSEINFLLGLGGVMGTHDPEGNRYHMRPLLFTQNEKGFLIELEISDAGEVMAPGYASIFRKTESGYEFTGSVSRAFGGFFAAAECARISFDIPGELMAGLDQYCLCMYDEYDPLRGEPAVIEEFGDRYLVLNTALGINGDPELRLYNDADILMSQNPDIASPDMKKGMDLYVSQFAPRVYRFIALPAGTAMDDIALMGYSVKDGHSMITEDVRTMIEYYGLTEDKVNIIEWNNPLSSYMGPLYFNDVRRLLFPRNEAPESMEPQAFSYNENVQLKVAAWDLGEGAHYAKGYSPETVELKGSPSIAVEWKNTGTGDFEYSTLMAMEYLPEDGEPVRIGDSTFYDLPLYVLAPGGVSVRVYNLTGFKANEHGKYRLWLNISGSDQEEITPRLYCVDMYF